MIEGLDGAGKTTQAKLLVESLKHAGRESIYLKEPTNGQWGMKIREIANIGRETVTLEEELSFFVNDRAEDAEKNIRPALESGKVVVMDRYIHSNIAYQTALGLDTDLIIEKNRNFPQPDKVFFLDIEPSAGLKRVDGRGDGANVGSEKIEFLEKVYEVFKRPEFDSMERIDATGSVEEIAEVITEKLKTVLG